MADGPAEAADEAELMDRVEALRRAQPELRDFPHEALRRHLKNQTVQKSGTPPSSSPSHLAVPQGLSGISVFQVSQDLTRDAAAGAVAGTPSQSAAPKAEAAASGPQGPLLALLESGASLPDYLRGLFTHAGVVACPHAEWGSPIFSVVRWVKAHPEMTTRSASESWKAVSNVIRRWGKKADDWWEGHFGISAEDAEVEFLHWWTHIRSLPTADPVEYALALADAFPLTLRDEVRVRARSKQYPRFVTLCAYLQRNVGARRPIFLPTSRIGTLLGVRGRSVARYCEWAVEDGYLVKVRKAVHNTKGPGLAAEYGFDLSRFQSLTEGQH